MAEVRSGTADALELMIFDLATVASWWPADIALPADDAILRPSRVTAAHALTDIASRPASHNRYPTVGKPHAVFTEAAIVSRALPGKVWLFTLADGGHCRRPGSLLDTQARTPGYRDGCVRRRERPVRAYASTPQPSRERAPERIIRVCHGVTIGRTFHSGRTATLLSIGRLKCA